MPYGYMTGGQRAMLLLVGFVLIITGLMMMFRVYPFAVPLSMPVGGVGIGGMMAWFWWVVGGVIIPPTLMFFGGWVILNGVRG